MIIKINEFINLIDNLSILEFNELIKALENKYNYEGISVENKEVDNKNQDKIKNYSLMLTNIGANKISVIKLIREINNLGLKESKDLVDSAPVIIKENIDLISAESIKKKLENCGSTVVIK